MCNQKYADMKKIKLSNIDKSSRLSREEKKQVRGGMLTVPSTRRFTYCNCGGATMVLDGHLSCPSDCTDVTGGGGSTISPITPNLPGISYPGIGVW